MRDTDTGSRRSAVPKVRVIVGNSNTIYPVYRNPGPAGGICASVILGGIGRRRGNRCPASGGKASGANQSRLRIHKAIVIGNVGTGGVTRAAGKENKAVLITGAEIWRWDNYCGKYAIG